MMPSLYNRDLCEIARKSLSAARLATRHLQHSGPETPADRQMLDVHLLLLRAIDDDLARTVAEIDEYRRKEKLCPSSL